MSIGYNLGIPAANNNPSNDQPLMLTNTNAINTWTGVDHLDFGSNPAGTHSKVSFGEDATVAAAPSIPNLFTDSNKLLFYPTVQASGSDQYTAAATGSVLLFNGMIVKWGTGAFTGSVTSPDITFVSAFPTACFGVWVTIQGTSEYATSVSGVTTSKFNVTKTTGGGNTQSFYYFAIGN